MIKKPRKRIEAQHQAALIKWCDINPSIGKYIFATLGGGSRGGVIYRNGKRVSLEGRNLKIQGARPGVPDLFFAKPSSIYHGLFIEMKQPDMKKAVVSECQKEWIDKLNSIGYKAVVCYGWMHAKEVILEYVS